MSRPVPVKNSTEFLVQTYNITVRFGTVVALNNFSVKIHGGVTGLLGPNGAGKSTLIKTVLGLVEAESGSIKVDSLDPRRDMIEVRDRVGYMPEHDCLIASMNPVGMISYMGQLSGMTRKDAIQRTHEVLDFVALGEERYRLISSYSTGMLQKAKLAQAIVHDPKILFLDEPTNGLDPRGRDEMLELIKKIGASGKTILVSSHILHEIEQVSQNVIIINEGHLVKQGPTASLMNPDETQFLLKVRGEPEAVKRFKNDISSDFSIISTRDESGQIAITIKGTGNTGNIFIKAKYADIQIRYFGPDTLTLEDVFVQAFNGGVRPGN